MKKLSLAPTFATQKEAFLAHATLPADELSARVTAELAFLAASAHDTPSRFFRPLNTALQSHTHTVRQPRNVISSMRIWRSLARVVAPVALQVSALKLVSTVGLISTTVLGLQILKIATEAQAPSGTLSTALLLCLGVLGVNICALLADYAAVDKRAEVQQLAQAHLVSEISRKLLRLEATASQDFSSGNLKTLLTSDLQAVPKFIDQLLQNVLPALISLAVMSPLMFTYAGYAGLIGEGVAFLQIPCAMALAGLMRRYKSRAQGHEDQLTTLVGEWLRNIRLVRFLSWQPQFQSDIRNIVRRFLVEDSKRHVVVCFIFGISFTWWIFTVFIIFVSAQLLGFTLNMAGFFGSLWLITLLGRSLGQLPNAFTTYATSAACLERIARLLAAPERDDALFAVPHSSTFNTAMPPAVTDNKHPVQLHFTNVWYAYSHHESSEPIVKELTFTLNLTQKTALVGPVGAGKSTLLKLICGLQPPTKGAIVVEYSDGSTGNLWEKDTHTKFRSYLAWAPQEPFISNTTIENNITLSFDTSPENSDTALRAAQAAELEADLALFLRGIKEEIGENGINLSGGQKQRVNLARALAAGRPFLVLDDPLSAVDVATENRLASTLLDLPEGFVLVSHRLAELRRTDRILVLQAGALVEDGTPAKLLATPHTVFAQLLASYGEPTSQNEEGPHD